MFSHKQDVDHNTWNRFTLIVLTLLGILLVANSAVTVKHPTEPVTASMSRVDESPLLSNARRTPQFVGQQSASSAHNQVPGDGRAVDRQSISGELGQVVLVAKTNTKIKSFMRKKLVAADQILEGLTTPNVSLIRKGATSMIHMNKEAMWSSFQSPSYAQDSADFVRMAERLVSLVKENDLEGASHAYAQLTIQCVTCHRRLRNQGVASSIPFQQTQLAWHAAGNSVR